MRQAMIPQCLPQRRQVTHPHIGEQQVLVMGHPQLAEAVAVGQIGDQIHLRCGGITRRTLGGLQADGNGAVAGDLVRHRIARIPAGKCSIGLHRRIDPVVGSLGIVGRRRKIGGHAGHFLGRQAQGVAPRPLPFGLHRCRKDFPAPGLEQDLDTRLVDVVTPAVLVVDPQNGFQIGEQVGLGQKLADHLADHRRPAEPATDEHAKAALTCGVLDDLQADVMDLGRSAVALGPGHGDLELARQIGEFGMQRRPLADDLAIGARIDQLVGGDAGQLVGGDVADAIAAGLDGMHLDRGQVSQDIGHALQGGPVVLDILARGEMAIAAVVGPRDMGQHAQLPRRQQSVGNGHAQHGGMKLDVQPVAQPQGAELLLAELPGQVTAGLVPELGDALIHQALVIGVITVHGCGFLHLPFHGRRPPAQIISLPRRHIYKKKFISI
jgi:hypothetical protein